MADDETLSDSELDLMEAKTREQLDRLVAIHGHDACSKSNAYNVMRDKLNRILSLQQDRKKRAKGEP